MMTMLEVLEYNVRGGYGYAQVELSDLKRWIAEMETATRNHAHAERVNETYRGALELAAQRVNELQREIDDIWRNDHPITIKEAIRRLENELDFCRMVERANT